MTVKTAYGIKVLRRVQRIARWFCTEVSRAQSCDVTTDAGTAIGKLFRKARRMKALAVLDAQAKAKPFEPLTEEDLETILIIARNHQSGRITHLEIKTLVAAYRAKTKE